MHKLGYLTKLSTGGFTANWNERAFALCGSSLYYADSVKALSKPQHAKLFANLKGATVRTLPDSALPAKVPVRNVFALSWSSSTPANPTSSSSTTTNGSSNGGGGSAERWFFFGPAAADLNGIVGVEVEVYGRLSCCSRPALTRARASG